MVGRFPVDLADLSTSYSTTEKCESDSSSSLLFQHHNLTVDFFDGFVPSHTVRYKNRKRKQKKDASCCGRLLLILFAVFAFLAIWFALSWQFGLKNFGFSGPVNYTRDDIYDMLMSEIDAQRIRENNRWLSSRLHISGTDEQIALMNRIEDEYRRLGFHVRVHEYEVLLSYPDFQRSNRIHALLNGEWLQISDGRAHHIETDDPRERVLWNAYAGNGTSVAPIVFANFGTTHDFKRLKEIGISVAERIVLIRYGANFRGDKVQLAQMYGAVGVILYLDPSEFAVDPPSDNQTSVTQTWMSGFDTQRGTLSRTNGDLQTPLLPSKPFTQRTRVPVNRLRESQVLPKIPVMPIGYNDAQKIMSLMDGIEVPWTDWRGGMPLTYKLNGTIAFRLDVHGHLKRSRIKNVIASWIGEKEPDRHVLLTNHVDAWTKGAVDPNSGTASMLELARTMSVISEQTGWRPRRTLVFCSFDAEEYQIIGSTEYVEEMLRPLQQKAVAVLNVDNINGNTTLAVKAVPMLYHVLIEAAAAIQQPNTDERSQGRLTLLDSWRYHGGSRGMLFDRTVPAIRMPTSGSDFQPFLCYVGIPAADLRMESAFQSGYAFYHTAYETYETMERLIDPTGAVFVAMAQFWMTAALRISENPIIPFDLQSITGMLSEWVRRLDVQLVHLGLDQALGSDEYREHFNFIDQSIVAFRSAATTLQQNAETVESSDIGLLNAINDRLMWIERSFVFDQGVYDNPLQRHVIYSPGKHRDVFPSIAFPGIIDPAIEWTRSSTVDDRERCLEAVRLGFAKLQYSIESATLTMYIDDLIY